MAIVNYAHAFTYPTFSTGRFPALQLGIGVPGGETQIDIDAYLDSGATGSLFDGALAEAIGLTLLDGMAKSYQTTSGTRIDARLHRVELRHEQLGTFELVVGFTTVSIARCLLGRDFFNMNQIGFRERQQILFVDTTP